MSKNVPWAPKPKFMEGHVQRYVDYLEDTIKVLTDRSTAGHSDLSKLQRWNVWSERTEFSAQTKSELNPTGVWVRFSDIVIPAPPVKREVVGQSGHASDCDCLSKDARCSCGLNDAKRLKEANMDEKLREALKPFADAFETHTEENVTLADFRRAYVSIHATPQAVPVSLDDIRDAFSEKCTVIQAVGLREGFKAIHALLTAHPVTPTPEKEGRVREALRNLVDLENRNDEGMRSSAPTSAEWRAAFAEAEISLAELEPK